MKRKKVTALFSSDLYSHPDKPLHVHLENVAERCLEKFRNSCRSRPFFDIFGEKHWEDLVWLIGFSHDLGKATSYFQKYLFEEDEKKKRKMKGNPKTSHGFLSAVLARLVVNSYLEKSFENESSDVFRIFPFMMFLMIKKHHGNLLNAVRSSDTDCELDSEEGHLDSQLESINREEMNRLFSFINEKLGMALSFEDIPDSIIRYFKREIRRKDEKRFNKEIEKRSKYYFLFQYLYSLLLHSDKEDVIFSGDHEFRRESIDCGIVGKFKDVEFGRPQNEMDRIRDSIFRETETSVLDSDISNKIFSLNVPTGTGKTLTCLNAALRLRERLAGTGTKPRIIYALPFTSIIDQNYRVFDKILEGPPSSFLLKHHHLAEISYKTRTDDEFETPDSRFLIESWESEIVVTTFFQIFHTLFTNRNRMIQKFHKFPDSIVLLDEIQSVPYKYWGLIRKAVLEMAELFDTRFILITATQPRIFEENEIIELVPNKAEYFSKLDRVDIAFEEEPVEIGKFIELCRTEIEKSGESFLFVMNTINSAIQLFKVIRECVDADFHFLSTNIIPKHRFEKIREIKESKKRKIIVSTQMVEAGVDIDIENVWRDFGPLESINQVCGRCNRNNGETKGKVRIFEILNDDDNKTPFSKYIYGKSPLVPRKK